MFTTLMPLVSSVTFIARRRMIIMLMLKWVFNRICKDSHWANSVITMQ